MAMKLINVVNKDRSYLARYDIHGSTPGRNGLSINAEVVFDMSPEGVKASVDIDFMPELEDFDAAKERLALYFEVLAKSLRESGDVKVSIPLVFK